MRMQALRLRAATPRRCTRLIVGALAIIAGCVGAVRGSPLAVTPSCRAEPESDSASRRVAWRLPLDEAERDRQDRWCAAVGSPLVVGRSAGVASNPVDSVAIVSWNTHGGGGAVVRMVSDLRAGKLTGGRPVTDFVLLLQEVYRGGDALPEALRGARVPAGVREAPPAEPRRDVEDAARALGLELLYVPSMRNGDATGAGAEDRGNAILSTLPLIRLRAIELPIESQRRVAVAATVSGTGRARPWELTVVSAHLDTRSTGGRLWASLGSGRRRQAEALVDALPPSGPTVIAGDLNTWSLDALESAPDYLRSRFADTPDAPDGATFATSWGYARRLDHMFFRLPAGWAARYDRVEVRYGSDHHPLLGWVVVRGSGEAPGLALAPGSPAPDR